MIRRPPRSTLSSSSAASDVYKRQGISVEIIDPRTLSPLDLDTILGSVHKTGRLVVVDEASPRCNLATDISAQVVSEAFGDLLAPVKMVSRRTFRFRSRLHSRTSTCPQPR